jgi:hypothetical protein
LKVSTFSRLINTVASRGPRGLILRRLDNQHQSLRKAVGKPRRPLTCYPDFPVATPLLSSRPVSVPKGHPKIAHSLNPCHYPHLSQSCIRLARGHTPNPVQGWPVYSIRYPIASVLNPVGVTCLGSATGSEHSGFYRSPRRGSNTTGGVRCSIDRSTPNGVLLTQFGVPNPRLKPWLFSRVPPGQWKRQFTPNSNPFIANLSPV